KRLCIALLAKVQQSPAQCGGGELRLKLKRFVIVAKGAFQLAAGSKRQAAVVITPPALGRQGDAGLERQDRLQKLTTFVSASALVEIRPHVVGLQVDCLVKMSGGFGELVLLEERAAEGAMLPGRLRREGFGIVGGDDSL